MFSKEHVMEILATATVHSALAISLEQLIHAVFWG